LTDTDFTDAEIRGANFAAQSFLIDLHGDYVATVTGPGITIDQLYSTSSYQAHDLSGIGLVYNDLPGANFSGQNLTNANFSEAALTGADFREANLSNVNFEGATLSDADFTGTEVRGVNLRFTGFTLAQLYSTASYQVHDLSGIGLGFNDLTGGNFADQN